MAKQRNMFEKGEDTPLFSGTPQRARPQPYQPARAVRQEALADCRVCLDTGHAAGTYCTCTAGAREREHDRLEREAERRAESNALHYLKGVQ